MGRLLTGMRSRFLLAMLVAGGAILGPVAVNAAAATYTVTNTSNAGAGSLRQAISNANVFLGADTINFAIGTGPKTIVLSSGLSIIAPVTIDGTTQPSPGALPRITVDGGAGAFDCFTVSGGSTTLKALAVQHCATGVVFSGSSKNALVNSVLVLNNTGVVIQGSAKNSVSNSRIGGQSADGVDILGAASTQNVVSNNAIGLTGSGADGNGGSGVYSSDAQKTTIQGNAISANGLDGVDVEGSATAALITNNSIGTDVGGTASLGNGENGVELGTDTSSIRVDHNLISGNTGNGLYVDGSNNVVRGNRIGTDATGTADLGNSGDGVYVGGAAVATMIGGVHGAATRNVISGNSGNGIYLGSQESGSESQIVRGNYIGTNAAGTAALPNDADGILADSGTTQIGYLLAPNVGVNVISGNTGNGITVDGGADVIVGNIIGANAAGNAPLGNGGDGVLLDGCDGCFGIVGGTKKGRGNLITANGGNGVRVTDSEGEGNLIVGNSIFANSLLGIELGNDGVTPNDYQDVDSGPNGFQNYPVLFSVVASGGTTTVSATLNSTPNDEFRIEFFANAVCDGSGNGEGQSLLGSTDVLTDGSGDVSFTVSFPTSPTGSVITMTATDIFPFDSSEFSRCSGPQ